MNYLRSWGTTVDDTASELSIDGEIRQYMHTRKHACMDQGTLSFSMLASDAMEYINCVPYDVRTHMRLLDLALDIVREEEETETRKQ